MSKLIIIGAGGHGRVVADATDLPHVFLDDDRKNDTIVGTVSDISTVQENGDKIIVAIGNNHARMELLNNLTDMETVIHPTAVVSRNATVNVGTVVFANAVINTGALLGRGCIVNTGATVDHDCILEDGVHVSPGAHLGGNVTIGALSWIGIGASVKHGITIGKNVVVGAGAVVVHDISDGKTVIGVPAKELNK
jgi:sugar O-acyltransferase (sialic acid O-acetyltransferase NeuD family)